MLATPGKGGTVIVPRTFILTKVVSDDGETPVGSSAAPLTTGVYSVVVALGLTLVQAYDSREFDLHRAAGVQYPEQRRPPGSKMV